MSVAVVYKDPQSISNFTLDLTDYLASLGSGLTVTGATWTVPAGITKVTSGFTTTSVTIQTSGGSDGQEYEALCHFVLSDGQEDEKALTIRVRHVEASDRASALTLLLGLLAEPTGAPTLKQDEVELILDHSLYASVWVANKVYRVGDRVVPVDRNGHYYEATQPGTSQGSAHSYHDWPVITGGSFSDGSSNPLLIWEEAGTDLFNPSLAGYERNLYDLGRAARECWLLKARKATQAIDEGDVSFSQWREHCLDQAKRFHPIRRPVYLARS